MSFRLVPNSVTLNDLEWPNSCLISPNSVAFWADCVKVVEDTRILSAAYSGFIMYTLPQWILGRIGPMVH